jgi:predicted DCC family thiol-disulfide oxidoreductase YuxK
VLCNAGVKWVIRADKHAKIKFYCIQSKAAEPYLMLVGMDQEDVLRRVLFVEGHEAYYEGSTGK